VAPTFLPLASSRGTGTYYCFTLLYFISCVFKQTNSQDESGIFTVADSRVGVTLSDGVSPFYFAPALISYRGPCHFFSHRRGPRDLKKLLQKNGEEFHKQNDAEMGINERGGLLYND